jgi:hypothetical protein
MYLQGCENTLVSRQAGVLSKHQIDSDKANWQPISYNNVFQYCEFGSQGNIGTNSRPLSNHGGADSDTIKYCKQTVTALDADLGFHIGALLRGKNTKFHNNTIDVILDNATGYCVSPIFCGENIQVSQGGVGLDGDGICCEGLSILNNVVNIRKANGNALTSTNDGHFVSLETNAIDVVIQNNTFIGLQNTGILIEGNDNDNIDIQSNIITFNNQRTGQKIANVAPKNSVQDATNVSFISNTVSGEDDDTFPAVKGFVDLATYTQS